MSLLFADIYEAIRCLRIQKGVSEKDILKYIQDRVGGCMKVANVLKTITTLKKLVEEGVLVQKGKRYMFSPNPPQQCDDEEEDEEEEEGDDDGEEDDDMNMDEDDDECCPDDDDDEDDDDDDDESEEEESEESSDNCDDKETIPQAENDKTSAEPGEDNKLKTVLKSKNFNSPSKTEQSINGNGSKMNAEETKRSKSAQDRKNGCTKDMLKKNKTNTVIDQTSGDGKNKGGEAIAFCTRDFIDSQYRPQSDSNCQIQPSKLEEMPQEGFLPTGENLAFGSMFSRNKRNSRMKRSQMSEANYRSRSPIRGTKPQPFDTMRLDHPDEIGSISSQLFQEPAEAEMEVDGGKDGEGGGAEFEVFRHRSPLGPPPPNTPGVHVSREESCCSNFDAKNQTEVKLEPNVEGYSLSKSIQGQMCREGKREGEKRPDKRGLSSDDEKMMSDDARASLCSICEKKKRNS